VSPAERRPVRVVLVRHAPAQRRDPGRWPTDEDRPLRPEARREFARSAIGLSQLLTRRGTAATSPLTRAGETAEILARRWRPARRLEVWEELRPDATMDELLGRVRASAHPGGDLVLFGHEPQLSRWLGFALTGEALSAIKFSKGGAVAIQFAGPPRAGGGQLRWALTRKQLGTLGRGRPGADDAADD
jgi:phosphohistidine phosphatase